MNVVSVCSGVGGLDLGLERAGMTITHQCESRVFVVAGPRDVCTAQVLADPDSVPRGAPPSREARQVVAALTANGVGAGGGVDDNAAQAGHVVVDLSQITAPYDGTNPKPGGPAPSLASTGRPITFGWSNAAAQGDEVEVDLCSPLRADGAKVGSGKAVAVTAPEPVVRRLTPREAERLMGWPDDWTRWRPDGTEIADSHRYRMCGNGVVTPVAEWIGRRIIRAEETT